MTLQDEIKQKAEEYSKRECPVNGEHYNQSVNTGDLVLYAINDFTAGANFILYKLRWRDPKEETPLAFKSGDWDGLLSDFVEAKDKFGNIYIARTYQGTMDGTKFCDFYERDDTELHDIIGWREII